MPAPVAVLDANVLYPAGSRDFFMRVHVEGVFQPNWTARVHDEWIRNVAANEGIPRANLERVRRLMDRHAADALVRGWQRFLPRLAGSAIDPKDRHVAAAALKARADAGGEVEVAIVTADVRGFPVRDLQALGLVRIFPDAFALALFERNADRVLAALGKMRAALQRPPFSRDRFVDELLAAHFPMLAEAVGPLRGRL